MGALLLFRRKWWLILICAILITSIVLIKVTTNHQPEILLLRYSALYPNESLKLSMLGKILYLDAKPPEQHKNKKNYKILVWKYGKTIENRHLKFFGKKQINPFEDCLVDNCEINFNDSDIMNADLVIFHLHHMKTGDLPKRQNYDQIWAFMTDESPYHTFLTPNNTLKNYNGVFNWSMTYRSDSDIPVPYGRAVLNKQGKSRHLQLKKRRDVLVAIMGSNCGARNNRWDYVRELQKHMEVDVYGNCAQNKTKKCPGHFRQDCPLLDQYLFYLAFENSNCEEYFTEKIWWNAYRKNAIPIVMGASKKNCEKLLPPNSYLHVEDFESPPALVEFILYLNRTDDFKKYFQWKKDYEILNEHGYFQSRSYHFCRACETLNYNERKIKVYDNLEEFWSQKKDCRPAWNLYD